MNARYSLLFILVVLVGGMDSYCQTRPYAEYPVPLQRLQLKLTTSFVYFHLRMRLDLDSAAILVSEGEHLPHSLYYDEDYRDGKDNEIRDLLENGAGYLFKSGAKKGDLDRCYPLFISAKSLADNSRDVYWQNAALSMLGRYYLQSREFDKGQEVFSQAVELSRKANNTAVLARALANRGTNSSFNDPQKEVDLTEALDLSRQQNDTVRQIEMLTRIYEIYFVRRQYDTVRKQLQHVTELEKAIGYNHIHYNHSVLAYLNQQTFDHKSAFVDCKKSIAIMEESQDLAFSNLLYGTMAKIYVEFHNYDAAIKWLERSMQQEAVNMAKRIWYPQFIEVTTGLAKYGYFRESLAFIKRTIRDYPPVTNQDRMHVAHALGYCYQWLNQRDSCSKYYAEMLPLMDSVRNDRLERGELFSAHVDLARYHLSNRDVALFKRHFQQAMTYADTSDVFQRRRMHWMKYKRDSIDRNYLRALSELRLAEILEDTIYNQQNAATLSGLHIEYEIENKDKSIELLEQKDKVQQATLAQSRLTRNVTLVGILIMVGITALVYNQYRNKQKRNEEMDQKNLELGQLVRDKDWLVKEIHHRVKNNLQIVSSLLRTQAAYLPEGDAFDAINESQLRMQVISLLHQKLYKVDTDSSIDMKVYIPDLVNCIRDSSKDERLIRFDVNVDDIQLDISQAVPVGLILNEAITNAIKYAYPKGVHGVIHIYLLDKGDGKLMFGVADEGQGLPKGFDKDKLTSLGMRLMETLNEQLEGTFDLKGDGGTRLEITFQRPAVKKEPEPVARLR